LGKKIAKPLAAWEGSSQSFGLESRASWTQRLADLSSAAQLPLAKDHLSSPDPRFMVREIRIEKEQWKAILERARFHGLRPSSIVLSCYAEILSSWSADPDITLSFALSKGRDGGQTAASTELRSLSLLTYRPLAGERWAGAIARLEAQADANILENKEVSAAWILQEIANRTGLAQPVMPFELSGSKSIFSACGWSISHAPQLLFDPLALEEESDGAFFRWETHEGLFAPQVPQAMFEAFNHLLEWLAIGDWSGPVCEVLPGAQREVRSKVNATDAHESGHLLHQGFLTQVVRSPQKVALIWGDHQEMTYAELGRQALQVAGLLVSHGVSPGEPVAVTLPKGPQQVVAVLGVLMAGAVYVPIGINQPILRRRRICAKAQVRAVLSLKSERLAGWPPGIKVLDLQEARKSVPLAAPIPVGYESLAYVIFTSGSTGDPKGVEISHRSAINTVEDLNARFAVTQIDRVLAVSALDFDLSVYDIFGLLSQGGAVVLPDEGEGRDARSWRELVLQHGITIWNSAPALLDMLLAAGREETLKTLRLVLVSGDWVGLDLPGRLRDRAPGARFVALGGATEAAIWSNAFEVTAVDPQWRSIPYGYPLRNQSFRVVNPRGRDCPDWVRGELWIGGISLARSYRGDPENTARQFVEADNQRWYRTGDQGCYWPNGTLEFLGRIGTQIKIRGFRIEPGEIEFALKEHPLVSEAVAVAQPNRQGEMRLIAYVQADGRRLKERELSSLLKAKLPDYMLPSGIVILKEFPLNANGKVDRRALPEPMVIRHHKVLVAPRNTLEAQLVAIWERVLSFEPIGITDDFFELGGDSLLAGNLFIQIERVTGQNLPLATLFQMPTIEKLAAALHQEGWQPNWLPLVAVQPHGTKAPFFCVHGGFGGVLCHGQLARRLGLDQPFYSLQAEGLDGTPIDHPSIVSMATYYLEQMRAVQPVGPYYLGGYSFGGVVAFEMAHQLRALEEEVAILVLFDTLDHQRPLRRRPLAERIQSCLQAAEVSSRAEKWRFLLQRTGEKLLSCLARCCETARHAFQQTNLSGPEADSQWRRALEIVQRTNKQALSAYQFRPYPGEIILLRAEDPDDGRIHSYDNGWSRLALGGLQIEEIPGQHEQIFVHPNVEILAGKLEGCLARAAAGWGAFKENGG
jgi:yersiniabactin nonribosomal peptide synthetase